MKRPVAITLACISAVLLAGCATSVPFNYSASEWNAFTPAQQAELRRRAASRDPVEQRGPELENRQLSLDKSTESDRRNVSVPPAVGP